MSFTLVYINVYHPMIERMNSEIQITLLNMTVSPCAVCPSSSGVFSLSVLNAETHSHIRMHVTVMPISVLPRQHPGCTAPLLSRLLSFQLGRLLLVFYSVPYLWQSHMENEFTNFRFHSVKIIFK